MPQEQPSVPRGTILFLCGTNFKPWDFCTNAKGFADMHGGPGGIAFKIKGIELAWMVHLSIARKTGRRIRR